MNDQLGALALGYASALREYLSAPSEAGLLRAYDLGHSAISVDAGIVELGAAHGRTVAEACLQARTSEAQLLLRQRAADFLGESLAPVEMMLRGYRENNTRLQDQNATLEQRVAARTAELLDSEMRFRTLADEVPCCVWTADAAGSVTYANRRWHEFFELTEDQTTGDKWVEVIHADDRERFRSSWAEAVIHGAPFTIEVRCRSDGDQLSWLLAHAVPMRNEAGGLTGWFGAAIDITDRKRFEVALQEADQRKDEFLATLAHELRNPLAPIRNAVELLRRAKSDTVLMGQVRLMMERQVAQMVRLIDDLLDITRVTSGKLRLRKERIELASVVQSAVETTRPHIDASAHELTVMLPPEPIVLLADATRLAQVFSNLLDNAAKYTQNGGHIWLNAERQGDHVVISVRDNGIGIPPQQLSRVFEMFSQLDPALERSQGGLGIGLALVKGLVQLHDGSIEAQSGEGAGSEFIVRLPIAQHLAISSPETESDADAQSCGPKFRLLVVDDNRDAADSLAMMLRFVGHDIRTAYDGLEGVQKAATFRPDVVLMDIGMPKLNGYEAASEIRRQPWGQHMALVAVTGWGQEEDKKRASEAGFDFHMVKPVEYSVLEKFLVGLSQCAERARQAGGVHVG